MNWRAFFEVYSTLRRTGQTTVIANAAKACGGVVLAPTEASARGIQREHGVDVESIGAGVDRLRGRRRVFLPDNHLVLVMLRDLAELQDRTERDQVELAKMDRRLAEAARVELALRDQVQTLLPLRLFADDIVKAIEVAGAATEHRDGCYGGTDENEACTCGTRDLAEALADYLELRGDR